MATGFLSPIGTPTQQFFTDQGVILSGGLLYTYLAGTTTPAPTFTTPNLAISNPNPIVLNSAGRVPQEVWLQQGVQYKFVLTDANNNPLSVGTFDNISGINDVSISSQFSEWLVSPLTPTFVNGTSFTVPGNQTGIFTPNRRIYATVTAGTIYGTVTGSVFGSNTTVTVVWDSGTLDNGLTQVAVGLTDPTNPSYLTLVNIQSLSFSGTLGTSNGANRARIRMIGGGGAGGGVPNTAASLEAAGGGGAPGGYLEFWVTSGWQQFNGLAFTVGSPGAGVSGGGGNSGTDTVFGAIARCTGGGGGQVGQSFAVGAPNTGPSGIPGTPGGVSYTGAANTAVINAQSGWLGGYGWFGGASVIRSYGGKGGDSPLGSGGLGAAIATGGGNGGSPSGAGAGGGGACGANQAAFAGGPGSTGRILIEEYL